MLAVAPVNIIVPLFLLIIFLATSRPIKKGGVGDLYIQAKVETPINLSKKQIEILRSFKEIEDDKDSPLKSAFFKKAKKFWSNK